MEKRSVRSVGKNMVRTLNDVPSLFHWIDGIDSYHKPVRLRPQSVQSGGLLPRVRP